MREKERIERDFTKTHKSVPPAVTEERVPSVFAFNKFCIGGILLKVIKYLYIHLRTAPSSNCSNKKKTIQSDVSFYLTLFHVRCIGILVSTTHYFSQILKVATLNWCSVNAGNVRSTGITIYLVSSLKTTIFE